MHALFIIWQIRTSEYGITESPQHPSGSDRPDNIEQIEQPQVIKRKTISKLRPQKTLLKNDGEKTVSKFCPKKRFRNSHGKTIPKNAFEIKRLKNSWRKNDLEIK